MGEAVYMDNNASTPMDPAVIDEMTSVMRALWANPSSNEHSAGSNAANVVENARQRIAQYVRARPQEIIFCSGSTEANNLALIGSFAALHARNRPHIVSSMIEHPSVLNCLEHLRLCGAEITLVPVGEGGRVKIEEVREVLSARTGLVSIMAANNETGVCQPIGEIGALCAERDILFHTDYSQAMAYRPLDVVSSNVHLASFSGHKMYGPKGTGVLYRRLRKPHVRLSPVLHGGGQERGLRPGTLNTPAIAGLGIAFETVENQLGSDVERLTRLRSILMDGLALVPGLEVNGDQNDVLINTISVSIQGVEPLALMRLLREDVIFSASSACSTDKVETSHVLTAMFGDVLRAKQSFRLGMGRFSKHEEIIQVINAITNGARSLRERL